MDARVLADLVVTIHVAFVVFVVLGGWLCLRWLWVAAAHIPAAIWGAYVELAGRICPLTPLENRLRAQAGLEGYDSSFIEAYVLPVLYPAELTRELQLVLGGLVIAINLAAYATVIWRRFRAAR